MYIPFLTRAFERGSNRRHLDETANLRLADKFGVVAEDAQRFGTKRNRLRLVGDFGAAGLGLVTLAAAGALPAVVVTAATTLGGRLAIDRFLPSYFKKNNDPNPLP